MPTSLNGNGVSPHVPKADAGGHASRPASLFPVDRPSFRPFTKGPKIGIKQWLHQAVLDLKPLANRILRAERLDRAAEQGIRPSPEEIDGDPAEDGKTLGKILRGDDRRRFDLDWLDDCELELGPEFMAQLLTLLNNRYGFQAVVPIPDPQRDEERKRRQEDRLKLATELLADIRAEMKAESER